MLIVLPEFITFHEVTIRNSYSVYRKPIRNVCKAAILFKKKFQWTRYTLQMTNLNRQSMGTQSSLKAINT